MHRVRFGHGRANLVVHPAHATLVVHEGGASRMLVAQLGALVQRFYGLASMFSGSQQKACAYQRCNGWRLVRQNAAPGGAQAWWGAQGLAGGQQSQFSVVAAATGGGGAGSQRCDLTQRKIPAVYI